MTGAETGMGGTFGGDDSRGAAGGAGGVSSAAAAAAADAAAEREPCEGGGGADFGGAFKVKVTGATGTALAVGGGADGGSVGSST